MAAGGVLWGYWRYETVRQTEHASMELEMLSRAKIKQFQSWIDDKRAALKSEVNRFEASGMLRSWGLQGQPGDFVPLNRSLTLLQEAESFSDVQIWDAETGGAVEFDRGVHNRSCAGGKLVEFRSERIGEHRIG